MIRTSLRNRHDWYTPLFEPGGISPDAPCPPACEEVRIGPGYFCAACLAFHPRDQHTIDKSTPPLPVNPEDRALKQIQEWQEILDGGKLDWTTEREVRARIKRLKDTIDEYTGQPTQCTPEQRGGIGNLKAKSLWTVEGLDFKVQAHTKGEAVQAFAAALRRRGETGRFSVSISNPRRVK